MSIDKAKDIVTILFVDFGNTEKESIRNLFELDDEMHKYPFQAFECRIGDIKPDPIMNPNGVWTHESTQKFSKLILPTSTTADLNNNNENKSRYLRLGIKVSHIEDDQVVVCELYARDRREIWMNVSDVLVDDMSIATRLSATEQQMMSVMKRLRVSVSTAMTTTNADKLKYYVPNRESDYTSRRAAYVNVDTDLKKLQAAHTTARTSGSASQLQQPKQQIDEGGARANNKYDEDEFCNYIELRGPYSPLEISYFGMTNIGIRKRIRVERDSINYVMLDDDPMSPTSRFMVAAEISLNEEGNTMILRKTSLMPKIVGLSSICCLLFAPTIELRPNEKCTAFTGAICGLGFDERTNEPIFKENDIECAFDIYFDANDLALVCFLPDRLKEKNI